MVAQQAARGERPELCRTLAVLSFVICMAACEPQPTPFPIDIPPTPTVQPPEATPQPIRYALAPNTAGFVPDLDQLARVAQVQQLSGDVALDSLPPDTDLIVAYGQITGWNRVEPVPRVSLVIGLPDDDLSFAELISRAIDPAQMVPLLAIEGATAEPRSAAPGLALREELANLGFPDGLSLGLGHTFVPGVNLIAVQLAEVNIEVRLRALTDDQLADAFADGSVDLALIRWTTPENRQRWADLFGSARVIDLYTLPVSYLAAPEIDVQFSASGWPIPARGG
jgi:hypothetical protein